MQFVAFTEMNESEGEDWRFWLQRDGNEEKLKQLKAQLDEYDKEHEEYELDMTPTEKWEVDVLVKHTTGGYMPFENKCVGILQLPELVQDHPLEAYYGGKIRKCFEVSVVDDGETDANV